MRKHFLILMLMALLPLAGFAEDISKGTIVVPSPFYGKYPTHSVGSAAATDVKVYNAVNTLLTENTDYAFDGFFADEACTQGLTNAQIASKAVGTMMYVKVTGMNGYENSLVASFEVKPMELTVTVANASKTYGQNDPASFVISSVKDAYNAEVATAVKNDVQVGRVAGEDVKYTTVLPPVVTGYAYTASMKTNNNYIVKEVLGSFTINPKAFTDGVTVDVTVTANLTYNGAAQQATVTVTDKVKGALTLGKDYTIAWTNNTNAHATDPTATITGKGNYAATDIVKNFEIKPAPLLVTPYAKKVYGNSAAVPAVPANNAAFTADIKFTYQGFVDAKTAADVTWTTANTTWASADATVNADTYKLAFNAGYDFTLANYTFIPVEGEFTITKLPITFTAANKTIDFGDAEVYALTDAWKATAIDADEANLENAIKITRAATAEASGAHQGEYKLTPAFKTDAEIDATAGLSDAQKAAAKAARDNYQGTFAVGYATINAAPLQIALKESAYTLSKTYDGQPVSITLNKESGLVVIGLKGDDVVNTDNLTLTVVNNSANAGTYQLKLDGAVAENYNITYIPSQYKINQKALTVTTYKQIFKKGEAPLLNTALYKIDETNGLAATDKASEVFKLAIAGVVLDGDGKVDLGAVNGKIDVVDCGSLTSKWANYDVTENQGDAIVVAATVITLDDSKECTDWAATPAGDPTPASDVMFTARNLNVEQWNVLVLPFDVTVKQISNAFGYAVVDVLDEEASDGDVHFKLKVSGTITANTPFLIYPSDENQNLNQIVFQNVVYKKPTGNVEKKDKANNKFIGTYKNTNITGDTQYYMSKGTFYYAGSNTVAIKPLRAYLDLSASTSAAPVIYIEEPGGNVTAIETINVERPAIKNEGWYTINGVKLQSAPTQKGIYIHNGKKFAVK